MIYMYKLKAYTHVHCFINCHACLWIWLPFYLLHLSLECHALFQWFVRASKFSELKLIIDWNCNFVGYYTIPFGFSLFQHFWSSITFYLVKYFVWLRITDEGSVPEMRIWSILLINSNLKWCKRLSRSLFLYWVKVWSVPCPQGLTGRVPNTDIVT